MRSLDDDGAAGATSAANGERQPIPGLYRYALLASRFFCVFGIR
jgi:hypothetical protein